MSDESSDHEALLKALLEKLRNGKLLNADEDRKSTEDILERKRKQYDVIAALINGENSGVSGRSPEDIQSAVKRDLRDQ